MSSKNNCLVTILVVLGVIALLTTCSPSQSELYEKEDRNDQCNTCMSQNCAQGYPDFPLGADQLIGVIYKPRAGPLHTNYDFPPSCNTCPKPFTAIYDQAPYLQHFG